jgi:tryptophan synthase alpha chain
MLNFPSPEFFLDLLELAQEHADFIEIGIPFSDPVADGPIIQSAAFEVLQRGFNPDEIFKVLEKRKRKVPIALMSYANPIWSIGLDAFCKACNEINVQALIIPDVPHEESMRWREAALASGLSWISFISLFTNEERLKQICSNAQEFIYLVSVAGVTGSRIAERESVRFKAKQIKQHTDVPIALGFGIRSIQDTEPYKDVIDAFIVGTKIIEIIHETNSIAAVEKLFREFSAVKI